jgi:hypothetical protein
MAEQRNMTADSDTQVERDYESYKLLLGLWQSENPIKTNKLQVLLAVNALLVSAISISGGFTANKWFVYLAGALFSLIWMFSIGRTSLFQDVWQIKLGEFQQRYPQDPRFTLLETRRQRQQAHWLLRLCGGISSKWYLLFSPLGLAIIWLLILLFAK